MGLPAKLTPEEQALLAKFALIKKKRKAQVKVSPVDITDLLPTPSKKETTADNGVKNIKPVKPIKSVKETPPVIAPKDAKEKAKQLLASGQLKIDKGSANRSFKRARVSNVDKKKELNADSSSSKDQVNKIEKVKKGSYKNFVASSGKLDLSDSDDEKKNSPDNNKNTPPSKKCFDNKNFENKNNFDNRNSFDNNRNNNYNRQSNNLFVTGYGLTKDMLDKSFPKFGQIKTIYFDQDKGHGFVTYFRNECAAAAIEALHGEMVHGTTLRVSYARRRNNYDNKFDDNRFTWRQRGNNRLDDNDRARDLDSAPVENSRPPRSIERVMSKTPEKKERKLVSYDDTVLTYDDNNFEF